MAALLSAWPLLWKAYLLALLQAALLGLVGVAAVARGRAFLVLGLAQASTFGVALAAALGLSAGQLAGGSSLALAIGCSVAASLIVFRVEADDGEAEAWLFLAASAATTVLLSHHPRGLERVAQIQLSRFFGASVQDLLLHGAALGTMALAVAWHRRVLVLVLTDPVMAAAIGLRPGRWIAALAAALGLVVGLGIASSGTLYTFGCLVLPALTARRVLRSASGVLLAAPLIGVATAGLGLVLAHPLDAPPGQLVVLLQAGLLAAVSLAARQLGPPADPSP